VLVTLNVNIIKYLLKSIVVNKLKYCFMEV